MASPQAITLLLLLLLSASSSASTAAAAAVPETTPAASFTLPAPEFLSTLRSTVDEIRKVVSIINTFSGGIGALGADLRLSSAVSDCLDLLDLSSDELTWTLSSSSSSTTKTTAELSSFGTGNRISDFRSWLSAALSNQDTCRESLSSAGGLLGSLVGAGLNGISTLISESLNQLPSVGGGSSLTPPQQHRGRRLLGSNTKVEKATYTSNEFPKWVAAKDRKLLEGLMKYDAVVAKDGSGNYTTVQEAVEAGPVESSNRYVIYIKRGLYVENVEVKKKKWNIMFVGDGTNATVISSSRNYVDGWTTFRSATLAVVGKGFIARDLTVENTAGAEKHQAVALRSDSDLSVFYRCAFNGYQDTLYAHSLRQFYRECRISGTVDYIFGNAAAVFQSCTVVSRVPLPNQKNTVTAQGRKEITQNTGFSLQFCNVTSESGTIPTYLGRPWKKYSRTVFMQSYMDGAIRPEGWLPWDGDLYLDTLYYGEYLNYGPGSALAGRVKWPGFLILSSASEAWNFTVAQFIDGNLWLPNTGVKYTAGLQL